MSIMEMAESAKKRSLGKDVISYNLEKLNELHPDVVSFKQLSCLMMVAYAYVDKMKKEEIEIKKMDLLEKQDTFFYKDASLNPVENAIKDILLKEDKDVDIYRFIKSYENDKDSIMQLFSMLSFSEGASYQNLEEYVLAKHFSSIKQWEEYCKDLMVKEERGRK